MVTNSDKLNKKRKGYIKGPQDMICPQEARAGGDRHVLMDSCGLELWLCLMKVAVLLILSDGNDDGKQHICKRHQHEPHMSQSLICIMFQVVKGTSHTQPPVSLLGQLLWREFFYTVGAVTPNFDRMEGNPVCRQIPWERDEKLMDAWTHVSDLCVVFRLASVSNEYRRACLLQHP